MITIKENIEQKLLDNGCEGAVYLTNPGFDEAIVGVTGDNRVVYDYDMMIQCLMINEQWSYEDSVDWIEYNTIRSIQYMGENKPIVIYQLI